MKLEERQQVIKEKEKVIEENEKVISKKEQEIESNRKLIIELARTLKENNVPSNIIQEKTKLSLELIKDL